MSIEQKQQALKKQMQKNNGILRCRPTWVIRDTLPAGRRLKLDPRDLYRFGADKGCITERYFGSTGEPGISKIDIDREYYIPMDQAIELMGGEILGDDVMNTYGGLISFAKLYDFSIPIPHHIHPPERYAKMLGLTPKPEAYFFPAQFNSVTYHSDYTFFGVQPDVTKQDIYNCLIKMRDNVSDNGILELSRAYKLKLDTGWNLPAGVLHAPGSLVTYEPQRTSDAAIFFQTFVQDRHFGWDQLKSMTLGGTDEEMIEFVLDMLDWEKNIDPDFKNKYYHEPICIVEEDEGKGYYESIVCYGSAEFSAKSLTVLPGCTVTVTDDSSYCLYMVEGFGSINGQELETPSMIGFNDIPADEVFVTRDAAREGVKIENKSHFSRLVMFKNFGPDNQESKKYMNTR